MNRKKPNQHRVPTATLFLLSALGIAIYIAGEILKV